VGNSSIGVRCLAPTTWSLYVPVSIKVSGQVLVTIRPIPAGQPIQAEDVQLQQRDITAFAGSALTSLDQAVDKNVAAPLASGTVLRSEMLRAANVILQGQMVRLVRRVLGSGSRPKPGHGQCQGRQIVSIKTRSGQIIKGIAKSEGIAEVNSDHRDHPCRLPPRIFRYKFLQFFHAEIPCLHLAVNLYAHPARGSIVMII